MVKYPVALAYGGLYGQVTELVDGVVRPLADTVVQVEGVDKATVTGPLGEFFRPLASGEARPHHQAGVGSVHAKCYSGRLRCRRRDLHRPISDS